MAFLKRVKKKIQWTWNKLFNKKRLNELSGVRVIFPSLLKDSFLSDLQGKRILEIGPKHGKDSILLASLKPDELILIDLPSKTKLINDWLPKVSEICNIKYIEGNLLYLTKEQLDEMKKFDIIWCTGVLYHNVEQLRLLKKLYDLCAPDGKIIIESSTTRSRKFRNSNVVEICWPETFRNVRTITHHPSRLAIKSWLDMIGFSEIKIRNIYSKKLSKSRVIITAKKNIKKKAYISYDDPENPDYLTGDSI